MRSRWTVLLLSALAGSCGGAGDATDRSVQELRELDTEEAAFVVLLNNYRASMGRPPLVATRLLNQVAYDHSLNMGTTRFFDHRDPSGRSPFDRMRLAGYSGGNAENIAAGNASAQRTFEQWRTSPGHNTNMLNTSSRAIGIGRANVPGSPYQYYWTNVFGTVVDSSAITGSTPPPTPTPTPSGACASGFSGSGTNGGSGARCLAEYRFNVEAGHRYTVSTCGRSTGDTYLVVSGACACSNDDFCDVGSECQCTATTSGVAVLCASTYGPQSATWNYAVTSTDGGRCSSTSGTPPTPPRDAGATDVLIVNPPSERDAGPIDVLIVNPPAVSDGGASKDAPPPVFDDVREAPGTVRTISGTCHAAPTLPFGQRTLGLVGLSAALGLRRRRRRS